MFPDYQFVTINKNWTPDSPFWELNPQIELIAPLGQLKREYGNVESSKIMWALFFYCEPSAVHNRLANVPKDERLGYIKEYFTLQLSDEEFFELVPTYEQYMMTTPERNLRRILDLLDERTDTLSKQAWTLENSKLYDAAVLATPKMRDGIEEFIAKIVSQGIEQQSKRKKSASESGLV